jgi:hypothetical protein
LFCFFPFQPILNGRADAGQASLEEVQVQGCSVPRSTGTPRLPVTESVFSACRMEFVSRLCASPCEERMRKMKGKEFPYENL